jgi:hypothetical protein
MDFSWKYPEECWFGSDFPVQESSYLQCFPECSPFRLSLACPAAVSAATVFSAFLD